MPYLQHLQLDGVLEGNLYGLMEQARIPGAQTCVPFPYIFLTNTPYLHVMHSVWQGDKGFCGIHKEIFQRHLTTEENVYAIWVDWDNPD